MNVPGSIRISLIPIVFIEVRESVSGSWLVSLKGARARLTSGVIKQITSSELSIGLIGYAKKKNEEFQVAPTTDAISVTVNKGNP